MERFLAIQFVSVLMLQIILFKSFLSQFKQELMRYRLHVARGLINFASHGLILRKQEQIIFNLACHLLRKFSE